MGTDKRVENLGDKLFENSNSLTGFGQTEFKIPVRGRDDRPVRGQNFDLFKSHSRKLRDFLTPPRFAGREIFLLAGDESLVVCQFYDEVKAPTKKPSWA